jgi:ubiquinone/menaquinone biosynthesis C-methylase UbiE
VSRSLIDKSPKVEEITIVDIGCGNGDMLRAISVDYGLKQC